MRPPSHSRTLTHVRSEGSSLKRMAARNEAGGTMAPATPASQRQQGGMQSPDEAMRYEEAVITVDSPSMLSDPHHGPTIFHSSPRDKQ
jgi:hypothetical protein